MKLLKQNELGKRKCLLPIIAENVIKQFNKKIDQIYAKKSLNNSFKELEKFLNHSVSVVVT